MTARHGVVGERVEIGAARVAVGVGSLVLWLAAVRVVHDVEVDHRPKRGESCAKNCAAK